MIFENVMNQPLSELGHEVEEVEDDDDDTAVTFGRDGRANDNNTDGLK